MLFPVDSWTNYIVVPVTSNVARAGGPSGPVSPLVPVKISHDVR
jgi:hypothetical protein